MGQCAQEKFVLGMEWVLLPSNVGEPDIVDADTGRPVSLGNEGGEFVCDCVDLL